MGKSSLDQSTAGLVVNLLSNDLSRFDYSLPFFHYIWCSAFQVKNFQFYFVYFSNNFNNIVLLFLQLAMIFWITWDFAGVAALVGCSSLLIASIPVYFIFEKLSKALRKKIATVTDRRVQIMNELVAGIQVKVY